MDITTIGYIIIALMFGYILATNHMLDRWRDFDDDVQYEDDDDFDEEELDYYDPETHEKIDESRLRPEKKNIIIEQVGGKWHAYDSRTSLFLSQGDTMEEMEKSLLNRYPDQMFVISEENMQLLAKESL